MSVVLTRACIFATAAHAAIGQKRKYTGEDYIVHSAEVFDIVVSTMGSGPLDYEMLAAAWLHDVVEDTKVTFDQLLEEFGVNITQLVSELTDISKPEDGNRTVRKRIDREHTRFASPRAKTIKLADLIHNTESITRYDPEFAKIYMAEKKFLLPYLVEGNAGLWQRANKLIENWERSVCD